MKPLRQPTRGRWFGLAVALLGVLGALYFGAAARSSALDQAVRQAVNGVTPALRASADGDPQAVVHRLVHTDASDMAFLTVRNAQGRLVASDGAWSSWFAGLASRATVRTWRAWMYRTLCAETYRSIPDGAALHAGVPWWRVLAQAPLAFWLTLLLACAGLALFERARRRPRDPTTSASTRPEVAAGLAPGKSRKTRPTAGWRESLQRVRDRWRHPRPADAAASAPVAAGFEPIGQRRRSPPDEIESSSETKTTAPQGHIVAVRENKGASPARPAAADRPESQLASEAAPVQTAEPGPATLDRFRLRFQPIWRGALDGLLAAAVVRISRVEDSGERVCTLEALMADGTAPERVVPWLVRRVATLQANWRTVELPRVPVMLALPNALLAFDNAREVWRSALAHVEPAAGELIVCVEQPPDWGGDALPVRWAVAEPRDHAAAATSYRLTASLDGERAELDIDDADHFTLPDDPAAAQDAQRPLGPRTFARLMSRSELVPL